MGETLPHMPPGLPLRSASPLWSGTPWNMKTLGQGRSHPPKWAISTDSELCSCQSDLSAVFREDASDLPPHIPGDKQSLQEAHVESQPCKVRESTASPLRREGLTVQEAVPRRGGVLHTSLLHPLPPRTGVPQGEYTGD